MKTEQKQQIIEHGKNLNKIFKTGLDPLILCKKLHRIENKLNQLTTDECNTGKSHHVEICNLLKRAKKILFPEMSDPELYKAVFVNTDPRGYALKIEDGWIKKQYEKTGGKFRLHTDMGGYGIICPEID